MAAASPQTTPPAASSAPGARHALSVLALNGALFLAFFAPVLAGDRLLAPGDGLTLYLPAFLAPPAWWSDLVYGGFPVAAEPQHATFYPPARLLALAGAWNAYVIAGYVLAASFTYGYVHTLTRSPVAAFGAGLVYGLGGFLVAHLGHTSMVQAAAWLPLLVWMLERHRVAPARWTLAAVALATALCALAGHPQILLYALVLGASYAWAAAPGAGPRRAYRRDALVALSLGLLAASAQILPTAELALNSDRMRWSFEQFTSFALSLRETPRLLFPFLFGGHPDGAYGTPDFGAWGFTETTGYAGIAPLALAVLAVALHHREPLVRFWLAAAAVGVVVALGADTPLAAALHRVPGWNLFRCPARLLVVTNLGVAVLCGVGIAALQAGAGAPAARRAAACVALLVGLAFALVIAQREAIAAAAAAVGATELSVWPWRNLATAVPLALVLAAAAALELVARRPASRARQGLLLAFLALDLGSCAWFAEWRFASPGREALQPPDELRLERATSGGRVFTFDGPLGAAGTAPPNLSRLWGIANAGGYSPLALSRYHDVVGFRSAEATAAANVSLDLLGVRHLRRNRDPIAGRDDPPPPDLVAPRRWRRVDRTADALVYENLHVLPRAWMVPRAVVAPPDEIRDAVRLGRLRDGSAFDPRRVALLEEELDAPLASPVGDGGSEPGSSDARVAIEAASETQLLVRVESARPGLLVLGDVHYPGWSATVDGRASRIHRTDYLLRGVRVDAGSHEVVFRYRPYAAWLGIALGIAALALLVVAGGRRWSRP